MKITETTTDMLFNLPALLTAQAWSKFAPSFLYSFEYKGSNARGSNFQSGLPMVAANNTVQDEPVVGHGDELEYLFDVRDLHGTPMDDIKPINASASASDEKVRNSFTNIIANFIRSSENRDKSSNTLFSPFTTDGGSFIKIGSEATLETDFRLCQLSLMGATIKSIGSTTCSFLVDELSNLNEATANITKELSKSLGTGSLFNFNKMRQPKPATGKSNSLFNF